MDAPILALLPGLNNTSRVWDGVVSALDGVARCHAPELPALDTVEAVADALLEQLPARFWLAGFSFGGYVALAMLERAPARLAGLALVNSSPRADTEVQRAARARSILAAQQGGHARLVDAQAQLVFHPCSLSDAGLMAVRGAMVADYGSARFIAHLRACASRPDRSAVLQASALPLLLIAAREDQVVPCALQRSVAESLPAARFVEIPAAGHMLPMEQPAAVARVLQAWILPPPPPLDGAQR